MYHVQHFFLNWLMCILRQIKCQLKYSPVWTQYVLTVRYISFTCCHSVFKDLTSKLMDLASRPVVTSSVCWMYPFLQEHEPFILNMIWKNAHFTFQHVVLGNCSCVAQLVDHGACNAKVVGSVPTGENVCMHYWKPLWIKVSANWHILYLSWPQSDGWQCKVGPGWVPYCVD